MGDRVPTMEDVAAAAHVSRALVSIVIRGVPGASSSTRERVLAAARDLDYQPDLRASRLGRSRTRTRTVGVVFAVGHAFHGALVDEIYVAADAAGYEVVLSGASERRSESDAVRTLQAERSEALLLLGSFLPSRELARLSRTTPTLSLLRSARTPDVDVIRTDDARGAALAVEHLGHLGHRRLLLLDGGRAPGAALRRRGFATGVRRLGPGAASASLGAGLTEEDGAGAAEQYVEQPEPRATGVVAFNDRCALGFIDVVRRHGFRVPEDVSVVGFDDIEQSSYPHVSLTTVRQDVTALGRAALDRVQARLDRGDTVARELVLPPSLVVRTSAQAV